MATPVNLKKGDLQKRSVVGFSWTTLFFSFFVPLFRKDWKWAGIMFGTGACVGVLLPGILQAIAFNSQNPEVFVTLFGAAAFIPIVSGLICGLYFAFTYNKKYTGNLLAQGFEPESEADRVTLKACGL